MKNLFYSTCLLVFFTDGAYSQKLSSCQIEMINDNIALLQNNTIYSIHKKELISIIHNSAKKYCLIVFYASWCGPCREELPGVIKYVEANKEKISMILINIERDNSNRQYESKQFLQNINYTDATFMISETYGNGKRTKYKNFLKDLLSVKIVPDKYLGLGQFLLYAQDNIKFISTYDQTNQFKIDAITQILKN